MSRATYANNCNADGEPHLWDNGGTGRTNAARHCAHCPTITLDYECVYCGTEELSDDCPARSDLPCSITFEHDDPNHELALWGD